MSEYKCALVTGATSGIGLAITKRLLSMDYTVLGVGRDFSKTRDLGTAFVEVPVELTNRSMTVAVLSRIREAYGKRLSLLVNNAGCAYYGIHESLKPEQIAEIGDVDLTMPMVITNLLLPAIRENRGTIVNISSVTALSASPHAAAYGAAKAGLVSFTRSLFAEERKHGVKVCAILPDLTDTNLYRNADFEADRSEGCCLLPDDVADALMFLLTHDFNTSEIVLQPQYNRIAKKKDETEETRDQ